jgi:CubicO group peptidase (beta-lactamase class C family)
MTSFRFLAAASLLISGAALARADAPAYAGLPRSTPEEQGIPSSAILSFVDGAEQKVDAVHSFMIVRHGHVVSEGWWAPYAADETHVLYSLSKSFTSTAVGLAIAEGKLSLDDTLLKIFPDEAPASPGKNLANMRVRDLLRMSTGQRDEDIKTFPFTGKADLIRTFLEYPVPEIPGTHFVYNTAATYILSAIVQKVTGQTVRDYLEPRLFEPLGIAKPRWDESAQGVSFGGFGLNLRTEDIARFGQLYLQKGQWQGRQLLPAAWVEEATSLQTANGSDPTSDWNQGYGYQFWRCRHGFFRGDGAFGQFCIVMPQFDAVVAVTSGTGDMQSVMNLIWDRIVPAMGAAALPADPESDSKLSARLAGLSLRKQAGHATSPTAARVTGKIFTFPENSLKIEALTLKAGGDGADTVLTLRIAGAVQRIECGQGAWAKGTMTLDMGESVPVAASAAWSSDDTYSVRLVRYLTPFSTDYDVRFTGDGVILEAEDNIGFAPPPRIRIVGTEPPQPGS